MEPNGMSKVPWLGALGLPGAQLCSRLYSHTRSHWDWGHDQDLPGQALPTAWRLPLPSTWHFSSVESQPCMSRLLSLLRSLHDDRTTE